MIKIEIGKETFLTRRNSNIWDCKMDQFGTAYCPSGLATARPYTSFYQSSTYERESTVIDYQNGSVITNAVSVVDYTSLEIPTYEPR
jgi:hypothetical protein